MKKDLEQVKEFHKTFNHPILDTPQIPDKKRCELRVKLLQEELDELKEAIENNDIVEVADALADLQYVLNGAALEFGLGDKFEALNDEVHRSNMSKVCTSKQDVIKTIEKYVDVESIALPKGEDQYILVRAEDNKILKSINYSPADLKTIVEQP